LHICLSWPDSSETSQVRSYPYQFNASQANHFRHHRLDVRRQYAFSQVAQFDHQNDPMDLVAFGRLPGKKSDNGDFGIEAHIGKLDHSLDLTGHRGAYEDELRI